MLEEIAKLLEEKKGILSFNDLRKIVEIVSLELHLDNSLANGLSLLSKEEAKVKFNMSDLALEFWYGGYYHLDKAIYLQYDNLYNNAVGNVIDGLTSDEKIIFINLSILLILLHELEHANQVNKRNGTILESIIIRESRETETDDTYAISPLERFANIHAYIQVLEIANMINASEKILNRLNKSLQNKLIYPYIWLIDNAVSPTIEYFKGFNKDEVIRLLEEKEQENNDIAFRLVFGLRLSPLEFKDSSWKRISYKSYRDVLYSGKSSVKSLRPNN